ncbi:hypothetical protein HPB52_017065 [Rhipicephalus sanguineus]|uniref:Uncharacterized protein n=1 Tax=Rhipicephalus sanguineus TaxID=34632 RepID=A0A9D4Q9T8_RHISA|nr:hypothetical protein HPB52_017065 [Rhipicephalus sanguineus]
MRRGSWSEDESVQGNPQVVVAPESQGNERFGELTPERRLEELRAEMEKLSQVISGSARDSELAYGRQDRCEKAWKSLKEECASERTSKSAEQIDYTQLTPVSGPLPTGKVRKLDVESPVLKAQGEIATMEGVVTQAVARSGDDEGPQGSRASPGETQAAGKKETSASEGCREKEQAGSTLQITGAGQDGIVERHRERSCFVPVPTGPRNLVQVMTSGHFWFVGLVVMASVQHSLAAAAEEILRVSRKRLWRSQNRGVRPRARVTF